MVSANAEVFEDRFPESEYGPIRVAGEFENGTSLANGGERIKLEDADGNTILEFRYDDQAPWPTRADGAGSSLQVVNWAKERDASPVYDDPGNWHDTSLSPGDYVFYDSFYLPGDADRDGLVTFADFLIVSANFGKEVQKFESGDFDGTGKVDFADFLILSGNFGKRR